MLPSNSSSKYYYYYYATFRNLVELYGTFCLRVVIATVFLSMRRKGVTGHSTASEFLSGLPPGTLVLSTGVFADHTVPIGLGPWAARGWSRCTSVCRDATASMYLDVAERSELSGQRGGELVVQPAVIALRVSHRVRRARGHESKNPQSVPAVESSEQLATTLRAPR